MTDTVIETRSVVLERELPYPPEKIWRALTQPHLMEEWLMKTDFSPVPDHRFSFKAAWGEIECRVLTVEQHRALSYTWVSSGLDSVVNWTLTPTGAGTTLRMEQQGFRPDQPQAYGGAKAGWPRFLGKLEAVLAGLS